RAESDPVAIIDEVLAHKLAQSGSILERIVEIEGIKRKVVGVCVSANYRGFNRPSLSIVYIPLAQSHIVFPFVNIIVRLSTVRPEVLRRVRMSISEVNQIPTVRSAILVEALVADALHI